MIVVEFVYWIVAFLLFYTYFGYPVLLSLKKKKRLNQNSIPELPSVTLLITAYNEELHILDKLNNSLELDYPREKLQILVANDGSTDKTSELVKRFKDRDIELLDLEHHGKTSAQNEGVKQSNGEIIVFSDANNLYQLDAIKKLISNFKTESVGAVCGELRYKGAKTKEGLYWKYEVLIKTLESRSGRLLGANGSIYGIKRKYYQELQEDAISDFIEPVLIFGNGYDVIYEPDAIAFEAEPAETFSRKRRIILRTLVSIKYVWHLLNPHKKRNIILTLISHKFLRWFVPIFLLCLLLLNISLFGNGIFYDTTLVLQFIFYLSAFLIKTVRYFLIVNLASMLAIWDWIRGKKIITWAVNRHEFQSEQ